MTGEEVYRKPYSQLQRLYEGVIIVIIPDGYRTRATGKMKLNC
jgi:hypothetical protein